jgi:hypothetical protein
MGLMELYVGNYEGIMISPFRIRSVDDSIETLLLLLCTLICRQHFLPLDVAIKIWIGRIVSCVIDIRALIN